MAFQVDCVESIVEDDQSQYSRFVIEPLERSQGTTVGNALRRVLLSNLEGTAVSSVRIAGASHEFSTIPGVREDVLDILLNMKETVMKSYSNQPQIGRMVVQGPAKVTAANFDLPSEVELISTDQYIASVSAGSTLEMEFRIEKGKGYRAIDRSREETGGVDFMQIDAVFMPVRKVNYSVENYLDAAGDRKDRLNMEIWTNGSLTAQQAMSEAAALLVDMFSPLKDVTLEPKRDGRHQRRRSDLPDSDRGITAIGTGL